MLRIDNISLMRNQRLLLQNISFEAKVGELVVILGSNGAGKSSLLKCISREWQPQQGIVSWNNKPLTQWGEKELARQRAVLTQHYQISLPFFVRRDSNDGPLSIF